MREVDKLLTVGQAAEFLQVRETAVYNAINEGRLSYLRTDSGIQVTERELVAYKERTRPGGAKPTGRPKGSRTRPSPDRDAVVGG